MECDYVMVFHYNGFVTSLPPVVPPPSSVANKKMAAFNGIPGPKSYVGLKTKDAVS